MSDTVVKQRPPSPRLLRQATPAVSFGYVPTPSSPTIMARPRHGYSTARAASPPGFPVHWQAFRRTPLHGKDRDGYPSLRMGKNILRRPAGQIETDAIREKPEACGRKAIPSLADQHG